MGASNNHIPAKADPANTETFTYELTNHGPSDAQHVSVSLPDHPGGAGEPTYFIIDTVCRIHTAGDCTSPPTGFSSSTDIGEVDAGATVDVVIIAHANTALGHQPTPPPTLPIISGPFTFANTATVSSPTDDPGSFPNVRSNLSPNVTIDTVASPPQNAFAIPGTGNAILTWETPSATGGQPITSYTITVTPPTGKPAVVGSPFTVLVGPHTSFCGNVGFSDCYQLTVSGLQNDSTTGPYTFSVVAVNAVGNSDPGTATATPSVNAKNAAVPTNTAQTLTTCTTATPTNPVCVQYIIPSGTGGVFGAQGNVALTANLCGGACFGTGAQALASLTGYNDPTHPLQELITFDSSQIPAHYKTAKVCANNSTATNCYPNNVQFYAEMSFALQMFPDPGGTLMTAHFCVSPVLPGGAGGAGNASFARPNPHTGPYLGYPDTSGSACIKKTNILGSKSDPAANGDVQVQVNLTSDSDQLYGKH